MIGQGVKVAAMFVGFGAVGLGGDFAVEALAQAFRSGDAANVDEVAVDVAVDVDLDLDLDLDRNWGDSERCRFEATRSVAMDLGDVRLLALHAGPGELEVSGRSDTDRVEAVARACASSEEALAELQLTLARSGGEVILSARYPERSNRGSWGDDRYARLDLVVRMPAGLDVDVDDSSGGMTVEGTGALRIRDSSGSIDVRDAAGSVTIADGSGGIEVRGVGGDLDIQDGSGGVDVKQVDGSVRIRDGSGSVDIGDVGQDVVVSDGSGSISVRDVGGDLLVRGDGSGGIRHSGVAGAVEIPRKKRR